MPEINNVQWAIFILGSVALVFVSRKPLQNLNAHGFYRFFAWKILLILFVLNMRGWFQNPFVWFQLISWGLLITSAVLVILGVRLLHQMGKQDTDREDASLYTFEKTSKLVTVGLYRYIRHPLYSSLFFLGWGMFFKSPSWLDAVLAMLCTFFLVATARAEERENIQYFGEPYREYMKRTKRFIPFVY